MGRYKSRASIKTIERDYPHVVEILVLEGGLGKLLDAMHEWHRARNIPVMHGRGRRDANNRDYIRWCFADKPIAEAFAAEFLSALPPKQTFGGAFTMSALCQ